MHLWLFWQCAALDSVKEFQGFILLRMESSWCRIAVDVMQKGAPRQQGCSRVLHLETLQEVFSSPANFGSVREARICLLPCCHSHRGWWFHFQVNLRAPKIESALSPLSPPAKFPKRLSEGEIIFFSIPQTSLEDFCLSRKYTMHHSLIVNTSTVLSKAALLKNIFIWDQKDKPLWWMRA